MQITFNDNDNPPIGNKEYTNGLIITTVLNINNNTSIEFGILNT